MKRADLNFGSTEEWETKFAIKAGLLAIAGLIAIAVFMSAMEARAFRKLTGRTDVTWFDALWVELRVDCER